MNNSISLFNNIYNKFMKKYYEKNNVADFGLNLTAKEEYYLDIMYRMVTPTASEFAKEARITKPAATQIINKLIEKGYLTKTQSQEDKRSNFIQLDEKVSQYFAESYAALDQLYIDSLSFLSKEEIKQMDKILKKIDRNL